MKWTDIDSRMDHELKEEGHKFRWTVHYIDSDGNRKSMDWGLVCGGIYVAVFDLLRLSQGAGD